MDKDSFTSTGLSRPRRSSIALLLASAGVCGLSALCGRRSGEALESVTRTPETVAPREHHAGTRTGVWQRRAPSNDDRASLEGRVIDVSGSPIERAIICASTTVGGPALGRCVRSNAQGSFAFARLSPDVSALVASAVGYLSRRELIERGRPMVITLEPGGSEVSGTVVDATGGPVPGALVSVFAAGSASSPTMALSDERGAFRASVPSGDVEVTAEADAYARASRKTQAPNTAVALVLVPGAVVRGRVLSADAEQPVAGVSVTARSIVALEERATVTRSDEHGAFRLDGLRPGAYELSASSDDWRSAVLTVGAELGEGSDPVELHVRPATTVSGEVTVAGAPCAGAVVELLGAALTLTTTSVDGSVRLEGVLPGPYEVTASCPHAQSATERLTVGHEPVTRCWELNAGMAIEGRVEDAQGSPLSGATVAVELLGESGDAAGATCVSDAEGAFSCGGLRPGEYACSVLGANGATSDPVRVAVSQRARATVVLRAHASATIRARVTASSSAGRGRRPSDYRVFARGPCAFPVQGALRDDLFVFERLPLGSYEVYVELPTTNGARARVELARDGQVVDLTLPAPASEFIAGTVVDERGVPLVDAWVSAVPSDALAQTSEGASDVPALSDERGYFSVTGLTPGTYHVHVTSAAGQVERRDVPTGVADLLVQVTMPAASNADGADADSSPEL